MAYQKTKILFWNVLYIVHELNHCNKRSSVLNILSALFKISDNNESFSFVDIEKINLCKTFLNNNGVACGSDTDLPIIIEFFFLFF